MAFGYQLEIESHCVFVKDNGLCSIYKERSRVPICLSVEEMIKKGAVLEECLYVKDNPEYLKRKDRRVSKERWMEGLDKNGTPK